MQTTDSNETPKRRLEDQHPAEKINWEAPGAPAVPAAPIAPRAAPLRAVASMSVSADGISFFATPSAHLLEHGHYMLPAPGAEFRPSAVPVKDLPARLQRDHERGILHPDHAHQCDVCQEAGAAQPQAAAASPTYRKLTNELSLKELAAEFCAVAELGGEVTLSSGACLKLFEAMTTPPEQDQAKAEQIDWISYDEGRDVLTIHGIKYSGELMRDFGRHMPQGQLFKLVSRKDETLCVQRIEAPATASLSHEAPEFIDGIDVQRLLRNLEETSYNEGSEALACRLSDCQTVIKSLLNVED